MKQYIKTVLATIVCLCMIISMIPPVSADNESNMEGVTFTASLNTPVLQVSNTDQAVTMRVDSNIAMQLESIGADIVWDSALRLTAIKNADSRIDFSGSVNLENGRIRWTGTANMDQLEQVTNVALVTFVVPANTPAGIYEVGISGIELTRNFGEAWENGGSATTKLTVVEAAENAYTANLSTLAVTATVGDSVTVNINASHTADTVYAAGEIVLTYDSSKLTFNEAASTLGNATIRQGTDTITLEDYGADKNLGNGIYVLIFTAVADGDTQVKLLSAAFVKKENAAQSDLVAAELIADTLNLSISKQEHPVTLPDILEGAATVTDGEDYLFSVTDGENYDYSEITATMDGVDVAVIAHGNGAYTIENVTGALIISATRTEKTYSVRFEGNAAGDVTDGAGSAVYNTNYCFTMPSAQGWAFNLESIAIGGQAYTGYLVENGIYTIPGSAIIGDIVITITKIQTEFGVTVEGTGAGAAAGYGPVAEIGKPYTLTLIPEAGYSYTVSAAMAGVPVTVVDNGDNTYTIENVTGSLVFYVERAVMVDGVSVSRYVTLNGTVIWLVKNDTVLAEGKVSTYENKAMFWSEKYDCYCYLVISQALSVEEAAANIGITDGNTVAIDYNMDVNKSGKVDASDAQMTYNVYNALYRQFDTDVTVEKLLRADINGDGTVNTADAVAIISRILG